MISTEGRTWSKLLYCFAEEMTNWENNLLQLLIELVPGLSTWLLPDWERNLGLPDECSPLAPTIAQRQVIAHAKYTVKYSGQSIQFYMDLAAKYDSIITIDSNPGGIPFRVDQSRVDTTPPDGINGSRLNSLGILHTWKVSIDSADPNKDILHCLFYKFKPAHTTLIWAEI